MVIFDRAVRQSSLVVLLSFGWLGSLAGQSTEFRPGDARIDASRIREHEATHRFIQYSQDGELEVGRLSRRVERLYHTADEPSILVSMQFRSPTRSGLDIIYLDATTLATRVRYLTSPNGMIVMFQEPGRLHVTFAQRNGDRMNADTTLSYARFSGTTDLLLASLRLEQGTTFSLPDISGSAATLADALISARTTFDGAERIDVPDVWNGVTMRYVGVRPTGIEITYWISPDPPYLIRQDFRTADGRHFLRWELSAYR